MNWIMFVLEHEQSFYPLVFLNYMASYFDVLYMLMKIKIATIYKADLLLQNNGVRFTCKTFKSYNV